MPVTTEKLASALADAVENAAHWRDYGADDPESEQAWQEDVDVLEEAMPLLLAAPKLLDAVRAMLAVCPVNWREDGEIAGARRLALHAIALAEGRTP